MPNSKHREDAVFTVSLDGIKLSDEQIKRIDLGIKEVVMREIAQIDHGGDLVINRRLELNPFFKGYKWPIWFGLWLQPWDIYRQRLMDQIK